MVRPRRHHARRGVTVLLVLGVLAVTIALSYAIMRTQVTSSQIQANLSDRDSARQAAQAGLMIALRKMHQSDWSGVDTQFSGLVESGLFYLVKYEAGDPTLTVGDAEYESYPYRVTITARGFAVDSSHSIVTASHELQAVVELTPRALSTQPADWASLQNHTVRQWKDDDVVCQTPVRVEGPVALQGPVKLCEDYPPTSRPWHGKIDEVAIFNRALAQDEIISLQSAALLGKLTLDARLSALDPAHHWALDESSGAAVAVDSAGGEDGTYENGTVAGASGYGLGNTCAQFDGRNDHINVGHFDIQGESDEGEDEDEDSQGHDEMTMLAFFKADSWDASPYARILSKATGTANDEHYWMLSTAPAGGSIRLRSRIRTNGNTTALVASSGNLSPGVWYLAAAVYDGSDMILYLNGAEVGRRSKTGALDTNGDVPVFIGESPPGSPQTRLLRDLEAMRAAGFDDWRPFAGPVEMPRSNTDDSTLAMLEEDLNLSVINAAADNDPPVTHPGAVATYQLYPGGPTYSVAHVTSGDRWENLEADPKTNPLGIFYVPGELDVRDGVRIQGTLVTDGSNADLELDGDNITLSPVELPPLYGTTTPIELPAAIVSDDLRCHAHTGIQLNGLLYAADDFSFEPGQQAASCVCDGMLLTGALKLHGRTEWAALTNRQWESNLTDFVNQLSGNDPEPYYPNWLAANEGLSSEPLLTLRPRSTAVSYHWQDWSEPVFVAHPDDDGLRWRIVRVVHTQ